jgi:glycosyltransferase involved in cell wall biosynthesis
MRIFSMKIANPHIIYDVILPFYNELSYLRYCIESILKNTLYPYRLFLIDDGSDEYTKNKVKMYLEKFEHICVHTNPTRLGYIKSYNIGLTLSKAEYIVLLSSHTYVLPGWLEKMIECIESDEKIGIVNPLTNAIASSSVAIPPGFTIYTMSERISKVSKRRYPNIETAGEFCMLMKHSMLNNIGHFDQYYDNESGEIAAFCTKAAINGWRVVVADDAFVFHQYFGTIRKDSRSPKNKVGFFLRLIQHYKYQKHRHEFNQNNPLRYVSEALLPISSKANFFKVFFSKIIACLRLILVVTDLSRLGITYYKKIRFNEILKHKKPIYSRLRSDIRKVTKGSCVNREYVENLPTSKGISVAFLVSNMHSISGGLISILQFVNEFIHRGHTAYIVTCDNESDPRFLNLYTSPIRYMYPREMAKFFPKTDIVVATYWTTAFQWVPKIMKRNPLALPFYYIQDFESFFYSEGDNNRRKVIKTYSFIPNKIVVSEWLSNKLRELGYDDAIKIAPGINLDIFYPRGAKQNVSPYRIVSIARPLDMRRGFNILIEVLKSLHKERKDIEIILIGTEDLSSRELPFPYKDYGKIWDRNMIAEIYSSSDVLIDVSTFQGFGLPGLEAMACGTPVVLTNVGGITEYAKGGVNCLMVNPNDIKSIVDAIEAILDNPSLRNKLIRGGRNTAQKFSHRGEAEKMLSLFLEQLERKKKQSPSFTAGM